MRQCNSIIPISKATISPDNEKKSILEYSLRCITGSEGENLYGLRVDKRCLNGKLLQREETPALTNMLSEATALAEAFTTGTVPPCVLLEMVDEWYSSFITATPKQTSLCVQKQPTGQVL